MELLTPEYLLSHGFVQYKNAEEGGVNEIPEPINDDLAFREKEHDRRMFVVIFSRANGDGDYLADIYVQEDAGCGFVSIPHGWWDFPVEYFESIYYGIRGEKPKSEELQKEKK